MVVTIALGRVVAAAIVTMFIAMLVAMFIGARRAVILRPILGTDDCGRQSSHGYA